MTKINGIVQKVLSDKQFSKFCLKVHDSPTVAYMKANPSMMSASMTAALNETDSTYTCASPMSPLSWSFPTTRQGTLDLSGATVPSAMAGLLPSDQIFFQVRVSTT